LDWARNRGVQESAGQILAFIDDDCEAHPDWLTAIRAGFSDPLVSFVTGRVRPAGLKRKSQQLFESRFPFDRGPCSRRFTRFDNGGWSPLLMGEMGTGANMAFRRWVLDRIGGFDVDLDMGTLVGGGGDLDAFARALDEGTVCQYAADAVVFHHHRDTVRKLRWQTWGYGVSQGAMCAKYLLVRRGKRLHPVMRYLRMLRDHQRRLAASRSGADRYPAELVLLELAGVAVGPLAYLASMFQQRRKPLK
jgi:GT2 family glycosyltransferase